MDNYIFQQEATEFLRNANDLMPHEILINHGSKLALHGLHQHFVQLDHEKEKTRTLIELLDNVNFRQCVVFVSSPHRARELNRILVDQKFGSQCIHSGVRQKERLERYRILKEGRNKVVVTTNLLGRGVDLEAVNFVINYDMPNDAHEYLHKVGRAGRFGTEGLAVSFVVNAVDGKVLEEVQSFLSVIISHLPDKLPPQFRFVQS